MSFSAIEKLVNGIQRPGQYGMTAEQEDECTYFYLLIYLFIIVIVVVSLFVFDLVTVTLMTYVDLLF